MTPLTLSVRQAQFLFDIKPALGSSASPKKKATEKTASRTDTHPSFLGRLPFLAKRKVFSAQSWYVKFRYVLRREPRLLKWKKG